MGDREATTRPGARGPKRWSRPPLFPLALWLVLGALSCTTTAKQPPAFPRPRASVTPDDGSAPIPGEAPAGGFAGDATDVADDPTPPPAGLFHTVAPGDTLWRLSKQHGVTVEELLEVNGLASGDALSVGQVLFVPTPAGAAPAAAGALGWPVDGVVLRGFESGKRTHAGLLVAAPAGTPVRAAAAGTVLFAGDQGTALGVVVILDHGGGPVGTSIYAHLARAQVRAGQAVEAAAELGAVGQSGGQDAPRLYFEVRRGGAPIDPLPLLSP